MGINTRPKQHVRPNCSGLMTALCILLVSHLFLHSQTAAAKATVTLINLNDPNTGLNDNQAATPEGGNSGSTLGEQRQNALRYAADLLEIMLASDVTIEISVKFTDQGGTSFAAPLAAAGPNTFHYDFSGAPLSATWYGQALANKLFGADLISDTDCQSSNQSVASCYDIDAEFNSSVDSDDVLTGVSWYYGLDGDTISETTLNNRFDLVTVALHEFIHGLGFISLVDLESGAQLYNSSLQQALPDNYSSLITLKNAEPSQFTAMSNAQRLSAMTRSGELLWTGTQANRYATQYAKGAVDDSMALYAPETIELGASVSHPDTSFEPDDLMEPYYTTPIHTPGLAAAVLADVGWGALADLSISFAPSANPAPLNTDVIYRFSVTNNGDFSAPESRLSYTLPTDTRYQSGTAEGGQCSVNSNTVECTVGVLEPGATHRVTLTLQHSRPTALTHIAEVFGEIVDALPQNNTLSTTTQAADVQDTVTAEAGPDQSTVGGNTITVDATNSSSTGSVITQYTFEQVSGIPQEITQSTPGQIEITAPSDGDDITIKVTVTDDEANSSSDFVVIVVNAPPLASIQVQNTTVSPGTTVTLDGANSSDRDGHIIQYMWTQTDGPSVVLQNAASATSTFTTPNEDTTLAFRLSVTDDAGVTASSDVSITVQSSTARSSGESRGGSLNLLPILSLFVLLFTAGRLTSRHRAEQ